MVAAAPRAHRAPAAGASKKAPAARDSDSDCSTDVPGPEQPLPEPEMGTEEWARLLVPALKRCLENETNFDEQKRIKKEIKDLQASVATPSHATLDDNQRIKQEIARLRARVKGLLDDADHGEEPAPRALAKEKEAAATPSQLAGAVARRASGSTPDDRIARVKSAQLVLPGLERLRQNTPAGEQRAALVREIAALESLLESADGATATGRHRDGFGLEMKQASFGFDSRLVGA